MRRTWCFATVLAFAFVIGTARAQDTEVVAGPSRSTVRTSEGFEAPKELVEAMARLAVPEDARFKFDYVTYDRFERGDEARQVLRFDPRLPAGSRWSVAELPSRRDLEKITARLQTQMEPLIDPDRALLIPPVLNELVFTAVELASATEIIYAFMSPADAERRIHGRLTVNRATGDPMSIVLRRNTLQTTYTLGRVERCCMVVLEVTAATRSARSRYGAEQIVYAPGIGKDPALD